MCNLSFPGALFEGNHCTILLISKEVAARNRGRNRQNGIVSVTKFAYLQELLQPKARVEINGLPLNTEGYEKAKIIIKEEYGKTSEVVNAYVNNILIPSKVNSFYKTLLFNVQSLETLVRGQENWQD